MSDWTKEKIEHRIRRRGFTTRLRFSTSKNLIEVHVYRKETMAPFVELRLEHRGWCQASVIDDAPDGVVGSIYRHSDVGIEHYNRTREFLFSLLQPASIADVANELIDSERLSPFEVPRNAELFARWVHFACVEWYLPLLPLSARACDDLRRGDDAAFLTFIEKYDAWWSLSADEKLKQMLPIQRDSPKRTYYLQMAKQAAQGSSIFQ